MSIKNFLVAGDYFIPVPAGLPLTLQYDENGNLEKIYKGFEKEEDISSILIPAWRAAELAPVKINVKGGTTWITGLLYTGNQFYSSGNLPECISEDLIKSFNEDSSTFNFFACVIESMATLFKGAGSIKQWLQMNEFNVLKGYLAPANPSDESVKQIVESTFNFRYSMITDCVVFHGTEVSYYNLGVSQHIVSSVKKHVSEDGHIYGKVYFNTLDNPECKPITCDWSTVVLYNLSPKKRIVLDSGSNIIYSDFYSSKDNSVRENFIVCDFCGNKIEVSEGKETICDDETCPSRLYPKIVRFLKELNLPIIEYSAYKNYCKSFHFEDASDILSIPEYEDVEVSATIVSLLKALTPVEVVANDDFFIKLSNICSNNYKTFIYYITHTDRILSQLNDVWATKFVKWVQNNGYVFVKIIDSFHVKVVSTNKKFDGAPIFRNVTFYLTGVFKHGNLDDITSILASYSGKVSGTYSTEVNVVIYGDMMENIDGTVIRQAKRDNKSIFSESMFFSKYEIDKDLAENLV